MPPSKQELQVATDALRTEAGIWDQQSDQLAAIVGEVEGLRLHRLEAGIFELIVSAYGAVVDQVSARCAEGHQRTVEVAATLRQVADTYDDEERRNEHAFRQLY